MWIQVLAEQTRWSAMIRILLVCCLSEQGEVIFRGNCTFYNGHAIRRTREVEMAPLWIKETLRDSLVVILHDEAAGDDLEGTSIS
jgi:hypothetical protein